ncbi:MAG: PDZ domain-containing protein [Candidatus Peribacteria bacterium]|nr:PDZ domain-containing protein [Candidatus Peribacteria bacterium]
MWKKLIIIVGGVAMNFLTARVIFTLLFRHGTQPLGISKEPTSKSYLIPHLSFLQQEGFATGEIKSGVVVQEVLSDSLAEKVGLQTGDLLLKLNDLDVDIENLSPTLALFLSGDHNFLTLQRGDELLFPEFECPEDCKL